MSDIKPIPINDDRLSPDMRRTSGGRVNSFYKPGDRSLQGDDADVTLESPAKGWRAELIDGQWFWVNECPECNGKAGDWTFGKCDKHDVCVTCGIHRSKLNNIPWGHRRGFRCKPCQDAIDEQTRREALAKVAAKEYDEHDYLWTAEPLCPHCASKIYYSGESPESYTGENECDICGGKYECEVDYSVTFTTTVIGDRVKE